MNENETYLRVQRIERVRYYYYTKVYTRSEDTYYIKTTKE